MTPVRNPNSNSSERGIALVAAVLTVLLTSMLVATYMTTTTGERAMSSNVQIAKASLYAADAGVRAQQQQMANLAFTKMDSCVTGWSGTGLVISNPQNMFPNGVFTLTSTNPPFTAYGTIAYADTDIAPNRQAYDYRFTISSQGSVGAAGVRRVQASGNIRVSAERGTFADYLIFLGQQTSSSGSTIWFTSSSSFDGRVHCNGEMNFAFKPTFYDAVTTTNNTAYYNNNGSPVHRAASNNGTIDVPNFYNGFYRNQATVPLPTNAYSQKEAALGLPQTGSDPTNATIRGALGLTGTTAPPNDIYLPNNGTSVTGGFYVQGSLNTCKMWADTTGNYQWYQMVQGTTTRTYRVDRTMNQTKVWNSSNTTGSPAATYTGIPNNAGQGSVLYVTGGISDLRGPDRSSGQVLPAIESQTKLLIAVEDDIIIQRDITCDNYYGNNNVLGIFTVDGKIRIGTGAPNDMNLDAFLMATHSTNGEVKVDNYNSGSPRGTFHLRGGIVEQFYGAFFTFNSGTGALLTGFARDFHYDKRGLVPPYYPSTVRFNTNMPTANTLSWKEI